MDLAETASLLARTPATLDAQLRGLPDAWIEARERPDTWTPFDIVGHLCHLEREHWMMRVRTVVEHGETRPFPPVDRFAQERESAGKTLSQLLDELATLRRASLDELAALNLSPADLEKRGAHPAFGAITLGNVIATWLAHDLTHLHQLSRILAAQCGEATGPWSRYLGVLHCDGHGEQA